MKIIKKFFTILALVAISSCAKNTSYISLAGDWKVALDSTDVGVSEAWFNKDFDQVMSLPGTTDEAQLGVPNTLLPSVEKPQILHLTRKYSYLGPAWYTKDVEIPSDWKDKSIELNLERVIWNTSVWVDGQKVDFEEESLISPHRYDLTQYLSPGKHKIAIRVDNRKRYDISAGNLAHGYTNDTQIIWNGVIGDISLTARDPEFIEDVQVYPNIADKNINVVAELQNNTAGSAEVTLKGVVKDKDSGKQVGSFTKKVSLVAGLNSVEETIALQPEMVELWSEFNPKLYTLDMSLESGVSQSQKSVNFGMREFSIDNANLLVNGNPVFLRGTLECNIFPLTGRPPMDKAGWMKVFTTAKEWGLNHLRFHSWCPPTAAFEVADSLGVYLQVELPLWSYTVGKNEGTNKFLYAEADRIIKEYGNHPSFSLFSLGNELQSDFDFMGRLIKYVKEKDSRHLYTTTSYTFEPGHGDWPEPNDDFFVTQRTRKGWVRGQGVFDSEKPTFDHDFSAATEGLPVPLVTHEIGQYAVYPNLNEIPKYTGTLDPLNFKGVKLELEKKNRLDRADDYLMASGKLAELLYKEEVERSMKTTGCSGIQLLDLHDFPGQGTALVGLLDAFWDNKGITESAYFREFSAPVVPLARFPKANYTSDENFDVTLDIANYSDKVINNQVVDWKLLNSAGTVMGEGSWTEATLPIGLNRLTQTISSPLTKVDEAQKLTLQVSLVDTEFKNSWNIWVYPSELAVADKKDIVVTTDPAVMEAELAKGGKVLFVPDYKKLNGLEGKFVQVFWSPVHFPDQAGTMGLFLNPSNPAFADFPTEFHTNWQWWSLLKQSKTLVIDELPELTPVVEMVDNFAQNRRLANLIEVKVGDGQLMFSSMDLLSDWENRPEAKQLYHSLINYMNSDKFAPATNVEVEQLRGFYTK